jgi:hypothetical protein
VLIDKQGRIRKHAFGAADDLALGAEIGALTQEAETLSGQGEPDTNTRALRDRLGVA